MDIRAPKQKKSIFYGWYIVMVGFMAYALGYGARYSFSVIFPSLLDEFGWPRDSVAAMLSVQMLTYGVFAPVAGHLVDRAGPRKTMVLGAVLLSSGLALSSWGKEPVHFYLSFGLLAGVGLCFIGAVPFTTVIRNWFERLRGTVLAFMSFGTGFSFTFYPAIAWSIDRVGWRNTFLVAALVLGGVMIPLILLIVRYHPREKDTVQDGLPAGSYMAHSNPVGRVMKIVDSAWASENWTFFKATRTSRYWLLSLSTFSLWGIMQHILVAHHFAYAVDVGYSKSYASSVLSLFGIMFSFGSLAGLLSDRIGREVTITISTVIAVSGIVALMLAKDTSHPWLLFYYAVSVGLGIGLCAPTVVASITDIFQGPKVGFVIGSIWTCYSLGGAVGPWLGGRLYELNGNYFLAFTVAIVLYGVGCGAIWLAAPRKVRRISKGEKKESYVSQVLSKTP